MSGHLSYASTVIVNLV